MPTKDVTKPAAVKVAEDHQSSEIMDEECEKEMLVDINKHLGEKGLETITFQQLDAIIYIIDQYWDG